MDIAFDQRHIWHPYTSMTMPLPCYGVTKAIGATLYLEGGIRLIDGMSSWWSVIHGYNHPRLNKALTTQVEAMAHVMFGGLTHAPAIDLCKKLIAVTPANLECIFLTDSGSVAVEVALKMAMQYWQAKGEARDKILSLSYAYHGDTLGAMAVCDPINSMHQLYGNYLPQHLFAPPFTIGFNEPWQEDAVTALKVLVAKSANTLAAIIVEPIVQGAGGMRMYHPNYLKVLRQLCDQYDILLIADEIATNFGRTGKYFACDHAAITPDILCLGKALTGGYMTLAATLTSRHIATTISHGAAQCFMHGPTFMANPLACAVALESLTLLDETPWQEQVKCIENTLSQMLSPLKLTPHVAYIRILGAIGVVELKRPLDQAKAQAFFIAHGIWLRPFGKLVYIMPPYMISEAELCQLTHTVIALIHHKNFTDFCSA